MATDCILRAYVLDELLENRTSLRKLKRLWQVDALRRGLMSDLKASGCSKPCTHTPQRYFYKESNASTV